MGTAESKADSEGERDSSSNEGNSFFSPLLNKLRLLCWTDVADKDNDEIDHGGAKVKATDDDDLESISFTNFNPEHKVERIKQQQESEAIAKIKEEESKKADRKIIVSNFDGLDDELKDNQSFHELQSKLLS